MGLPAGTSIQCATCAARASETTTPQRGCCSCSPGERLRPSSLPPNSARRVYHSLRGALPLAQAGRLRTDRAAATAWPKARGKREDRALSRDGLATGPTPAARASGAGISCATPLAANRLRRGSGKPFLGFGSTAFRLDSAAAASSQKRQAVAPLLDPRRCSRASHRRPCAVIGFLPSRYQLRWWPRRDSGVD